jgi:hypothetical protein
VAAIPKPVNFIRGLKIIGLLAFAAAIVGVLMKFGLFKGKTEADKLQDKQDTQDKADAITLSKSKALKISGISDFSKLGLGVAEGKNQFPYTPAEVADMVMKIHATKTTFTKGDGSSAIAAINAMPSKFTVNNIALSFANSYSEDLFAFLKNNITDEGLAAINTSITSKPDFKKILPATQTLLTKYNETLSL